MTSSPFSPRLRLFLSSLWISGVTYAKIKIIPSVCPVKAIQEHYTIETKYWHHTK